jgi:hypothetical protein
MIQMVRDVTQGNPGTGRCCLATDPTRDQHPGVERHTDHRVTVNQGPNHFVAELAIVWDEGAGVGGLAQTRPSN